VKRSALGTEQSIFTAWADDSNRTIIRFSSGDALQFLYQDAGTFYGATTNSVYRDASAWYYFVFVLDTANSTSANRVKLYVNGDEVTTLTAFGSGIYPPQNTDYEINATVEHLIAARRETGSLTSTYFSGYLANIHFIDGQALTPSSFTETDATTGQLIPKTYTGSYGTNGFNLLFADNSSNTASTLGKDTSGNSNNWTPNNLSVTAGAGNDSLVDSPTNGTASSGGDAGGTTTGNYPTLNPLANSGITLSNGNLDFTSDSGNIDTCISTFAVSSGKWYWELSVTDFRIAVGIEPQNYYPAAAARTGFDSAGYAWWIDRQEKYHNGSNSAYGASTTSGDLIGIALDLDAGTLVFYKNNVSQGTAYSGITGTYLPAICDCSAAGAATGSLNFGQRPFAYTAPSGFKALNTANLPAPLVTKSNEVFDVVLYTADVNGGKTISMPGGFSPDLVWIKNRDNVERHYLIDKVRGDSTFLNSNTTANESGAAAQLVNTSLTLGNSSYTITDSSWTSGELYFQNRTYASWCWDAGTSTVSNTQGSITSQVRANATAGFSVVTYTGTGSAATVGHGLGIAPSLIITKPRNNSGAWGVYHASLGATKALELNDTSAAVTSIVYWNDTAPTASVFSVRSGYATNASGYTYVGYCFSPVVGYNSFGSYVGNGSSDGPFCWTGFRPRFILQKRTDSTSSWQMWDTARNSYNETRNYLLANASDAEANNGGGSGSWQIDILSNGFKVRSDSVAAQINASGGTYVWAAFAESPFNYARAR